MKKDVLCASERHDWLRIGHFGPFAVFEVRVVAMVRSEGRILKALVAA